MFLCIFQHFKFEMLGSQHFLRNVKHLAMYVQYIARDIQWRLRPTSLHNTISSKSLSPTALTPSTHRQLWTCHHMGMSHGVHVRVRLHLWKELPRPASVWLQTSISTAASHVASSSYSAQQNTPLPPKHITPPQPSSVCGAPYWPYHLPTKKKVCCSLRRGSLKKKKNQSSHPHLDSLILLHIKPFLSLLPYPSLPSILLSL